MKTTRIKILFTVWILSATALSVMQVDSKEAAEKWYCLDKEFEKNFGGAKWYWVHEFLSKKFEKEINDRKRKLLTKVEKKELFERFNGQKRYLTFLDSAFVEEVRDELRALDIPDSLIDRILILGTSDSNKDIIQDETLSLIEKILILGKNYMKKDGLLARVYSFFSIATTIPYAILVDTKFLAKSSPLEKKFVFLHEGGHVKSYYLGVNEDNNRELDEVMADIYALASLISGWTKGRLQSLACLGDWPYPYLSSKELVYHGEKLFDIQQRGNKVDVPTYARKIITDRKKDDYEERITQGAKKLLEPVVEPTELIS